MRGFTTAPEAQTNHERFDFMARRAHEYVIRIAFHRLVSGRPKQAYQTLDETWPRWDGQRIEDQIEVARIMAEPLNSEYVSRRLLLTKLFIDPVASVWSATRKLPRGKQNPAGGPGLGMPDLPGPAIPLFVPLRASR